jgi:hypothetical protein
VSTEELRVAQPDVADAGEGEQVVEGGLAGRGESFPKPADLR